MKARQHGKKLEFGFPKSWAQTGVCQVLRAHDRANSSKLFLPYTKDFVGCLELNVLLGNKTLLNPEPVLLSHMTINSSEATFGLRLSHNGSERA